MTGIEWADPPAAVGGKLTRKEQRVFADELRGNPGRWAVYPTCLGVTKFHLGNGESSMAVRALASRINRGKQSAFGEGFEAVCRHGVVYVRFMGDGGQE